MMVPDLEAKDEIVKQENKNKKGRFSGFMLILFWLILALTFVYPVFLIALIIIIIFYKKPLMFLKFLKICWIAGLYFMGVLFILSSVIGFIDNDITVKSAFIKLAFGLIILPPLQNKINAFLKPKFYSLANEDCEKPSAFINITYGAIKFIIFFFLFCLYLVPIMDSDLQKNTTKKPAEIQKTISQKKEVKQEAKIIKKQEGFKESETKTYDNNDIDRLTSLAVLYGRGIGCGANLDAELRETGAWIDSTFGADRGVYTMIFSEGLSDNALRQNQGRSPDSCSDVLRNLR